MKGSAHNPVLSRGLHLPPDARLGPIHAELLKLCDALEAVADALPGPVDTDACRTLADRLGPLVRSAQRIEEQSVYSEIEKGAAAAQLAPVLTQLRAEHWADACLAEEVQDALNGLADGQAVPSAEAVGYMLRGFFQGMRRHVAFEQAFFASQFSDGTDRTRLN